MESIEQQEDIDLHTIEINTNSSPKYSSSFVDEHTKKLERIRADILSKRVSAIRRTGTYNDYDLFKNTPEYIDFIRHNLNIPSFFINYDILKPSQLSVPQRSSPSQQLSTPQRSSPSQQLSVPQRCPPSQQLSTPQRCPPSQQPPTIQRSQNIVLPIQPLKEDLSVSSKCDIRHPPELLEEAFHNELYTYHIKEAEQHMQKKVIHNNAIASICKNAGTDNLSTMPINLKSLYAMHAMQISEHENMISLHKKQAADHKHQLAILKHQCTVNGSTYKTHTPLLSSLQNQPANEDNNTLSKPHDESDIAEFHDILTVNINTKTTSQEVLLPDKIADEQLLNANVNEKCARLINQMNVQTVITPSGNDSSRIENIDVFLDEELQVWSPVQKKIITARLAGHSLEKIRTDLKISSDAKVLRIIKRALSGNTWTAFTTGRTPAIGAVQEIFIKTIVKERADELDCIDTNELISIVEDINGRYMHREYMLALLMNHPSLATELLHAECEISYQYLNLWVHANGMELKSPQKLVHLRRKYCHANALIKFYDMLNATIHQIPELLFNADETALALNTGGKVIVPQGAYPTKSELRIASHYSAMFCFNACGYTMQPFIILPNLKTLPPELNYFSGCVDFAVGPNGWMTSNLFAVWALVFCRRMRLYRLSLDENIRNKECFLLLDGHKSRLNGDALELFAANNIRVIVLPSHSSHCTQPFDVGLGGPFKTRLRQLYASLPERIVKFVFDNPLVNLSATAHERFKLVYAMLDAWRVASTKRNCVSAFEQSGIYPLNVEKVLARSDVKDTGLLNDVPVVRGININGMEITSVEKRVEIAAKYYSKNITSVDQIPMIDEFALITAMNNRKTEKLVSKYPISILEVNGPEGSNWSLALITRN